MAANDEIHHAAAFKVVDPESTEKYLDSKGIQVLERDDDTLLTEPTTTHGVPFRWTNKGRSGRSAGPVERSKARGPSVSRRTDRPGPSRS